ncbi:nuclease-related domain-containing protein [Desulfobaculum bizertense]|uniref:Nuclease-related domain-containing protein n=1 Tax=Desulfobaculum bizertense DSM 18034 TaxID=1121442 RepID=A0A1T4VZ78_9BACT|nr:nuclease-related domain-containing protein [Desulfobaculum bizertense]UIJ37029.1 NERD domain-containing protein [Desulfobaculum bizertense]SKA70320.1 Nuclease-related domain-containing protein [Desulfobaculum bizertense DSM 18034]
MDILISYSKVAPIVLIIAALAWLLYKLRDRTPRELFPRQKKKAASSRRERKLPSTPSSVICSEHYLARIQDVWTHRDDAPSKELSGARGEAASMQSLEHCSHCAVYWNIGVRHPTERIACEIDHLVVSPQRIYLIETKSYAGDWEPADGEPSTQPKRWQRTTEHGTRTVTSPLEQVLRDVRILSAVIESMGLTLPIVPIVCFAGSCRLKNIHDKRVVLLPERQIAKLINSYEERKHGPANQDAGTFLRALSELNFWPEFYDPALIDALVDVKFTAPHPRQKNMQSRGHHGQQLHH